MTVGFFLMTEKGVRVLEAVIDSFGAGQVAWVMSARDGNLVEDHFENIASTCATHGIEFYRRGEQIVQPADYVLAVSWRWLIPNAKRLIVLHDSLLPKYRGFAPLPAALINGETAVGVTALLANDEYDKGPILGQRKIELRYPVKIRDVIRMIGEQYSSLAVDLMAKLVEGQSLIGREQDEGQATYCLWRDEDDYRISWGEDATNIKRFVDSVGDPYRGASSLLNGVKVRISESEVEPDVRIENRQPGKVIFLRYGYPVVVCGRGLLKITELRVDQTQQSLLPLTRFRSRFT
jgi:methionyl-tRNA formyltransferase